MLCQGAELGPERDLLRGPAKRCPARRPEKTQSL